MFPQNCPEDRDDKKSPGASSSIEGKSQAGPKIRVIRKPEAGSNVSPDITEILKEDGFYIGSDPSRPALSCPILVMKGRAFSLRLDNELRPEGFIIGNVMEGPFGKTKINTQPNG